MSRPFHCFLVPCIAFLLFTLRTEPARAFEQDQRINALTLQFGTDTFATRNTFGGRFGAVLQPQLETSINSSVASGSIALLFTMPGLTDLTGTNDPSFQIGLVNGTPVIDPANPVSYSGTSDLDWWYTPNAGELDSNGVPINQLSGAIVSRILTAGPGRLSFASGLVTTGRLDLSSVLLKANVGSSSAPLRSTNNFPPGHRPSENLDPHLVSFASMSGGQLKGTSPQPHSQRR